jgi:hypothetical protein
MTEVIHPDRSNSCPESSDRAMAPPLSRESVPMALPPPPSVCPGPPLSGVPGARGSGTASAATTTCPRSTSAPTGAVFLPLRLHRRPSPRCLALSRLYARRGAAPRTSTAIRSERRRQPGVRGGSRRPSGARSRIRTKGGSWRLQGPAASPCRRRRWRVRLRPFPAPAEMAVCFLP